MSRRAQADSPERPGPASRRLLVGIAVAALVGSAAVALALIAFGGPRPELAVGTTVGQSAPDFSLRTLEGGRTDLASMRGKPTVVWFTAAYCLPCQEGAITLGRILDDVGAGRVGVLMVFVDPTEGDAEIAAWRDRFGRPGWTYARGDLDVIRAYDVAALDTKLLLDAEGVVRAGDSFPLREDVWRAAIERNLAG